MSVTKNEIRATLKAQGLGFVRLSHGSIGSSKVYTNPNTGKRVSGIYAANYGPMTVTNAHNEQTKNKMHEVTSALAELGMFNNGENVMVSNDGNILLRLTVDQLPAYSRQADLDPEYKNIYIIPTYI